MFCGGGRETPTKENMNGNIAIAGAALGGTIALGLIGYKAAEAVGRNPGASGKILVQALSSACTRILPEAPGLRPTASAAL